jgi:hypothetical protein
MFGDKDPELKALVQMEMTLDPDDPDDVEKKNKFLAKLTKEHKKDVDELINEKVWNIHDEKGNLVPHLYRDGKFIKYDDEYIKIPINLIYKNTQLLYNDDRQQSD